jgi:hypothetical protein
MPSDTAPGGVPKYVEGEACKCEENADGTPKTGNAYVTARDVKVEEHKKETQYFSVCLPGHDKEILYKVTLDNSDGDDPKTFSGDEILRALYAVVTGNNARAIADPPEDVVHTAVEINLEQDELSGGSSVSSLVFLDVCGIDLRSATSTGAPGRIATSGGEGTAPWFNVLIASPSGDIPLRGPPEKGGSRIFRAPDPQAPRHGQVFGQPDQRQRHGEFRLAFGSWAPSADLLGPGPRWQPGFELVAGGFAGVSLRDPWMEVIRIPLEPVAQSGSAVLQTMAREGQAVGLETNSIGPGSAIIRAADGHAVRGVLLRYTGDVRAGSSWHVAIGF